MKNIFKSYMKLFIRSWVETLGTIIFLTIFTMIVMGMLATPLQLSLHALSVRNNTNIWQQQMQGYKDLDDNFVYNNIFSSKKGDSKFRLKYNDFEDVNLEVFKDSWFTCEAQKIINNYVNDIEIKDNENKEQKEREAVIRMANFLIDAYKSNGDEIEVDITYETKNSIQKTYKTEKIKSKDIFTTDVKNALKKFNAGRDVNSYLVNSFLKEVSKLNEEKDLKYDVIQKINIIDQASNFSKTYNYTIESTSSLYSNTVDENKQLNNLVLRSGRLPNKIVWDRTSNPTIEVVINDNFARKQQKMINNNIFQINLPTSNDEKKWVPVNFKIVGYAEKYSALAPVKLGYTSSVDNYAHIFVDKSFFIGDSSNSDNSQTYFNDFILKDFKENSNFKISQDRMVSNYSKPLNESLVTNSNEEKNAKLFDVGTTVFEDFSSHDSIKLLTNLYVMTYIFLAIGIILFLLAFFFIIFVLKKEINNTRRQLGVFKSIGYKTRELTWVFSVKTFISMTIGIGIGYFLSIPFQIEASTKSFANWVVISFDNVYSNPIFLTCLIILVPLLFAGLSYLIIYSYLSENALALLSTGVKKKKWGYVIWIIYVIFFPSLLFIGINKILLLVLKKKNQGFTYRMQEAFVSSAKGKFVLILTLIGFSGFLFMLQLQSIPILKNMINGSFGYLNNNVDHYYKYSKSSTLSFDGKIKDTRKAESSELKYIDIKGHDSVISYLNNDNQNTIIDYNNISKLLYKLSDVRKEVIKKPINGFPKIPLPLLFNFISLTYPLKEVDDLNIDKLKVMYSKLITDPDNLPEFLSEQNILNMSNNKTDKHSAIKINDIGKYFCLSFKDKDFEDCNDTKTFKKTMRDTLLEGVAPRGISNFASDTSGLSNINTNFRSLITEFLLASDDVNTLLTSNVVLYDSSKEALVLDIPYFIEGNSEVDKLKSKIFAIDTTNKHGDINNIFNLSSITQDTIKSLGTEVNERIPVIISFRLAKLLDAKVGDIINNLKIGKKGNIIGDFVVVGINNADTLQQTIYADYNLLLNKYKDDSIVENGSLKEYFTSFYSTKKSLSGKLDLENIQNLVTSFTNHLESTTISTSTKNSWLGTILDIYLRKAVDNNSPALGKDLADIIKKVLEKVNFVRDENLNYVLSGTFGKSLMVMPIIKSAIDALTGTIIWSMVMYVIIDMILLTILLIVIMNIIIVDAINIITIMRSLGYSNAKVNWMVMGRYITGGTIVFICAYIVSILTWNLLQTIVWNKFGVLVLIPSLPWVPFLAYGILSLIMLFGWIAAMAQIRKQPLTYLVS